MNKVSCYQVAFGSTTGQLREHVEYFLIQGFVPIGGISVISHPNVTYYQAMVKYEDLLVNQKDNE